MTVKETPLAQQKELLCLQLQAQRILIYAKLNEKELEAHTEPKSMMMKFLTQQNGVKIIAEGAALMLGTRWLQSVSARTVAKIAKSLLSKR